MRNPRVSLCNNTDRGKRSALIICFSMQLLLIGTAERASHASIPDHASLPAQVAACAAALQPHPPPGPRQQPAQPAPSSNARSVGETGWGREKAHGLLAGAGAHMHQPQHVCDQAHCSVILTTSKGHQGAPAPHEISMCNSLPAQHAARPRRQLEPRLGRPAAMRNGIKFRRSAGSSAHTRPEQSALALITFSHPLPQHECTSTPAAGIGSHSPPVPIAASTPLPQLTHPCLAPSRLPKSRHLHLPTCASSAAACSAWAAATAAAAAAAAAAAGWPPRPPRPGCNQ